MFLVAESVYDGTWSGNTPAPAELADFELMREMGWSWADLEDTPAYVRRYCADFMQMRRAAEARALARRQRPGG